MLDKHIQVLKQAVYTGHPARLTPPSGTRVTKALALSEDSQKVLSVWFEVDENVEEQTEPATVMVIGTGWSVEMNEDAKHVDTYVSPDGFVWHLYQLT